MSRTGGGGLLCSNFRHSQTQKKLTSSNAGSRSSQNRFPSSIILSAIRTTRIAGGLLLGYNPWKAGARLKTPAFTLFRPYCP